MLNILIASDHKLYREALTCLLNVQPFCKVASMCADTHAAINIAAREQPDIVFIDGSNDPLAAIEATKKIVSCSSANVIAVSRQQNEEFAQHMVAAGALGYLTKVALSAQIIMAVNEVAKDNLYLCFDNQQQPIPTPKRTISPLKQSLAFLKQHTHKKINTAAEVHWHRILQFTN